MKTLYRAIALEDVKTVKSLPYKKGFPMSSDYSTKELLIQSMKSRAACISGIPFRVEEVYIVEEGDVKDLDSCADSMRQY